MDDSNYQINDRNLVWLLALVCGVTTGENYFCQSIIKVIQESFKISTKDDYSIANFLYTRMTHFSSFRRFI